MVSGSVMCWTAFSNVAPTRREDSKNTLSSVSGSSNDGAAVGAAFTTEVELDVPWLLVNGRHTRERSWSRRSRGSESGRSDSLLVLPLELERGVATSCIVIGGRGLIGGGQRTCMMQALRASAQRADRMPARGGEQAGN